MINLPMRQEYTITTNVSAWFDWFQFQSFRRSANGWVVLLLLNCAVDVLPRAYIIYKLVVRLNLQTMKQLGIFFPFFFLEWYTTNEQG